MLRRRLEGRHDANGRRRLRLMLKKTWLVKKKIMENILSSFQRTSFKEAGSAPNL